MARLYGFSALAGKPVPHRQTACLMLRRRLFRVAKDTIRHDGKGSFAKQRIKCHEPPEVTAYQSAGYGKTAKTVIFRENSVRGVRVSEYGSFRDNVLTFRIHNMLIYIYQNYSAILYPPFFPTLSPVPQTKPRAAVSQRRSRDITAMTRRKVRLHACAETPK